MSLEQVDTSWKKRIALFLVSQNLSLFGSSVVGYAMLWHITLETSSGVWMMLITICALVPQVLVSLFGGVWADRHNRKHLIMLADGFIALATLILAIVFLLGYTKLELLLLVAAVRSVGAGIQTPAVSAIFPQLVPMEQLTRVQGINQTLISVLMLLAPAVGGIILGTIGLVGAFFVDVVTATLAILVLSFIKVEKLAALTTGLTIWQDIRSGIAYTFGHGQLRRMVICCMVAFFLITPAAILTPLLVERTFGSEIWRLTLNEIAWTVGSIFGGVFVTLKAKIHDKAKTVAICLMAFGVMFGLLGIAWDFPSYLVFMGIAGCFLPLMATAQTVYIQEITSPDVLGRVFSVVHLFTASAMPVAILLFGPLADVVSVESILIASGAALAVVGALYMVSEKRSAKAPLQT
jgi:DHA3 family macrolide efflux protein-like MFS transporter